MGFVLSEEKQQIIDHKGKSLLVSAAAGSGKTTVLVRRLLHRVTGESLNLDDFLIITFTKASAADLRNKIVEKLGEEIEDLESRNDRTDEDEATLAHLRAQTTRVYRAQISTIDSFCQSILQEYGHLIGIAPDARPVEDQEEALLQTAVLDELLEQHYSDADLRKNIDRIYQHLLHDRDDKSLAEIILYIYNKLQSYPDPEQWLTQKVQEQIDIQSAGLPDRAAVTGEILRDAICTTQNWIATLKPLIDQLKSSNAFQKGHADTADAFINRLESYLGDLKKGWDTVCQVKISGYGSAPKYYAKNDCDVKERYTELRNACISEMKALINHIQSTEAQLQNAANTLAIAPGVIAVLNLVKAFGTAYTTTKRERNLLDYSDMEHLSLRILQQYPQQVQDLLNRFAEVMVDEYQDTNAVQNALFDALSGAQQERLFMVGDIKQSIYRFRLADPSIFLKKSKDADEGVKGAARKLVLNKNYRSTKSVLDAANYVFGCVMSEDLGDVEYNDEHWLNVGREDQEHRPDPATPPTASTELHVLTVEARPGPQLGAPVTKEQSEADYVARRIYDLVAEGNYQYKDIAILHRSLGSMYRELTRALKYYGIPYQHTGEHSILDSVEVSVALSYLQILDNPHQDIPLIGVLRSPLYNFTVDQLAELRTMSRGDFYGALQACKRNEDSGAYTPETVAGVARFLQQLDRLKAESAAASVADTLWNLYEATGLLDIYTAAEDGEAHRKNLITFYQYAQQFTQNGKGNLHDFIGHLRKVKDSGLELKVRGSIGKGVRLMTIHGSKGLEFPVVFVIGLGKRINEKDETEKMLFHVDLGVGPKGYDSESRVTFNTVARDEVKARLKQEGFSEEMRLLYVAMTRAREKLVMVTTTKKGADKDTGINNELKKIADIATGYPVSAEDLQNRNHLGDWVVAATMTRPEGAVLCPDENQKYCHQTSDTKWDIRLKANHKPDYIFKVHPIEKNGTSSVAEESSTVTFPYQPAMVPAKLSPSKLGHGASAEPGKKESHYRTLRSPNLDGRGKTLSPTEKGTAVHLFMQLCDPEKGTTVTGVQEELERLVQNHFMTPQQAEVCEAEKVVAFFTSDLGKLARRSEMHKEFNFSILVDASEYYDSAADQKILVQGVVDLWFETQDGIVIVDFKTDAVSSDAGMKEKAEHYRPQLAVYARALERITGMRVISRYLWFTATSTAYEVK